MEEQTSVAYFHRIDELINTIRGLGEDGDKNVKVQRVLRNLPIRFNPNVCVIEEMRNLKKMTMDELQGILTAYAMRIEDPNPKEAKIKEINKNKVPSHSSSHSSE